MLSALEDDGDVIEAGNLVGGVPLHTFSLFNKVDINEQFSIALGYYYQDTSFASSDNSVRLPSYSRFDAGLFYRFDELIRIHLSVEISSTGTTSSTRTTTTTSPRARRGRHASS